MKREWEVNWGFFQGLAIAHFFCGLVATVVCASVYRNHDGHAKWAHSPIHWIVPVWLGPFAVVAAAGVVVMLAQGARELWRHPPVRRVTRPVQRDLRDNEKGS